jgi:hypothetical protein
MGTKVPVKILDEQRSTICGIRVDLHNYIRDDRTKRDILEKLEHIKINVKYTVPMRPDYQKREYITMHMFNCFCFAMKPLIEAA